MQHFLKTNPQHFKDLINDQLLTIRKDDRNFKVNDEIIFICFDGERACGDSIIRKISHIQKGYGLKDGYVALSVV